MMKSETVPEMRGNSAGNSVIPKESIRIGKGVHIDSDVLLGYLPSRKISRQTLHIGNGASLRSGTVIYAGTSIGNDFETGHNVVIREENTVGDRCSVWSGSIIDYGCRLGNDVRIHSNCYVAQYTTLERGVFLAPGVVTANDLYPGFAESKSKMRGPLIRAGAQIGVNATLLPFIEIGRNSIVGAGSVITRDVPPRTVVAGNPARVMRPIPSDDEILARLREFMSK